MTLYDAGSLSLCLSQGLIEGSCNTPSSSDIHHVFVAISQNSSNI
jgi:hypothetical protein